MTITPERQKLIDRIAKLLALADSTTHSEEADTARRMAAELMAKHNISTAQAAAQDPFQSTLEKSGRVQAAAYETTLLNSIAKINGVCLLVQGNRDYIFIGRPSDLEAFKYLREIVYRQRTEAWRTYYPTRWNKHPGAKELNRWKNGFALGVSAAVNRLMNAAEAKTVEWGLVVVDPAAQALAWYKEDNKVGSSKSKGLKYNPAGFEAGSNVSLNKGIESKGGATLQIGHKK